MSGLAVLHEGGSFFDAPRWRDGCWWVSDFYRERVITVEPGGRTTVVMAVPGRPSGMGWLPDASLLVVSQLGKRVLRRFPDGTVRLHADVASFCGGSLNDLVVDRQGRAYAGEFGFDLERAAEPVAASLIRIDADGSAGVAAAGLHFPNGAVITPDGRTLIVGESMAARYTAFTIGDDGSLEDRRIWAQLGPTPALVSLPEVLAGLRFGVDGCALDAENHLWSSDFIGARCARIAPGGDVVDEIAMPAGLTPFACMLGGDDGRTLLICAAPDFDVAARSAADEAVLFTAAVDSPHAGLP